MSQPTSNKLVFLCIGLFFACILIARTIFKKESYTLMLDPIEIEDEDENQKIEEEKHSKKTKKGKEDEISFMTKEQASHFLMNDPDGYGTGFNSINLYASGRQTTAELLSKWASSTDSFTEEEKNKLRDAVALVRESIRKKIKDKRFQQQLLSIKWQFAKTIYPYYVDGLSHTRFDIIWISDKTIANSNLNRLAKLCIHEYIHIWERSFPESMEDWIETQGFIPIGKLKDDPMYRCNPDVNDKQYQDKNGMIMYAKFRSQSPSNLMDVAFPDDSFKNEHPYEHLAYKMEQIIDG